MSEHIWEATADGIVAFADYIPEHHHFKISVSLNGRELTDTVEAMWEPRFGIDVGDSAAISDAVEKLAQKLEEK